MAKCIRTLRLTRTEVATTIQALDIRKGQNCLFVKIPDHEKGNNVSENFDSKPLFMMLTVVGAKENVAQ